MKFQIKTITISLIAIVFLSGCGIAKRSEEKKESQERYKIAKAMFDERCKKSGVFIHKTVKDVDGIFLMKVRPEGINYSDQYKLDDPYGRDLRENSYIRKLLRSYHNHYREESIRDNALTAGKQHVNEAKYSKGYSFIEAADEKDGKLYRYTGESYSPWKTDSKYAKWVREYKLKKIPIEKQSSQYGLTYSDISTKIERDYWIAGSSLRVIDLQTNEVIAERIGYMMDYGQGSRAGGRSPWLFAADMACPNFRITNKDSGAHRQAGQTLRFLETILIPKLISRKGK